MIKANLTGEIPHIIKGITNVIGFLGETKGGEPVPLRKAEVNRMLGNCLLYTSPSPRDQRGSGLPACG